MKRILLILILLGIAAGVVAANPFLMVIARKNAASGPSFDFMETFEADEYDNTWSETVPGGATVDGNATHSAALTGGGTYCLNLVFPDSAVVRTRFDKGNSVTNFAMQLQVYIDDMPTANFDRASIISCAAGDFFNIAWTVEVRNQGGTPYFNLNGGGTDQTWAVALDTWYQLDISASSNGGTLKMKVDGADEKSTTTIATYYPRYFALGAGLYYDDVNVDIDNFYVNWDTTDYLE